MGRTALAISIINEDLPMVQLLLTLGVDAQDALLHAISEEFVEAVELLLDHEDAIVASGHEHSWESLPPESRSFSSDITPLILAAQLDRFEIVRMLLDRGATLPVPHNVRCGCSDCVTSRTKDSIHHSRSRMNTFKALASPSLICLTAKDPIHSAFQLSWELRSLSDAEHEFRSEYKELKNKCKLFATALLDHTRTSRELEIILNYDPLEPVTKSDGRMLLRRLRLAVKLHQKQFVTHPNVQQLLVSIWYEGLPGFRRKKPWFQILETLQIAILFPILSLVYVIAPTSELGKRLKKPFIKFICHSASYLTFLVLLILVSLSKNNEDHHLGMPSVPECLIFAWLCGMIKLEIKKFKAEENRKEYLKDMWKVMDIGSMCLYVIVVILRILAYNQIWIGSKDPLPEKVVCRKPDVNVKILSECLLSAANIFSCLRMVYIFSVSPYLGPMQVSLSRMVIDMVRFFLLFILVLFAFSCGMLQLLSMNAGKEWDSCCKPPTAGHSWDIKFNLTNNYTINSYENDTGRHAGYSFSDMSSCFTNTTQGNSHCFLDKSNNSECFLNITSNDDGNCDVRLRFVNLLETMQTLFWTVFGVIEMNQFNLQNIEHFTKFWAKLMLGTYSIITNIVLLNLLIAMLNNSYQLISGQEDIEWKFARSKLWISYFDDKCTLPPPFNIFPTSKFLIRVYKFLTCCKCRKSTCSKCCYDEVPSEIRSQESGIIKEELLKEQDADYEKVMRHLVRRYILMTQQGIEHGNVCEDDINELKQDISAFRCELIDILQQTGFKVSAYCNAGLGGRKTRQRERRMMKDFDVIPSNESLVGLWPGQPPHMQKLLVSATAPVLSNGTRRASGVGSAAIAALKKKRRTFFATHKNREPIRTGSVPVKSSQSTQCKPFMRTHSQRETIDIQDTVSPSTTNESITTYSSDTFDASTESRKEIIPPTVCKDDL
ncbi:hypothetical protein C0J52_17831 [Blattella germanica]|nr:hypothetical protein C0J52_17831 [Blattella germanica]